MKKELELQLKKEFPNLYSDLYGDCRTTCMAWGFECGDGWFQLLYDLSSKLEPLVKKERRWYKRTHHYISRWLYWIKAYKIKPNQFVKDTGGMSWTDYNKVSHRKHSRASQVKEKYGTLRFYMTTETKEMTQYINEAESLSAVTCETCGNPGKMCNTGWCNTICDDCKKKKGW